MKTMLFALLAFAPAMMATAQSKPRMLKKAAELKMPKTADDDMPGTRGASVAWHPVQKKYYASFAGYSGYPMAVFDVKGKRLSSDDQAALADVRGLWYNPAAKAIQGNTYDNGGWFSYKLDKKGLVTDYETLFEGMNQPTDQCVGAFNAAQKQVYFLKGGKVWSYSITDAGITDSLVIHWGRTTKEGAAEDEDPAATPENYNYTTLVYTGLPNASLGVLNITERQIELYNAKTGFMTQKISLPNDAPVYSSFNFAYTNGIYWLFNQETRVWLGYK